MNGPAARAAALAAALLLLAPAAAEAAPLRQGAGDELGDLLFTVLVVCVVIGIPTAIGTIACCAKRAVLWVPLVALGWVIVVGGGIVPLVDHRVADWWHAQKHRKLGEVTRDGIRWTGSRPFEARWADMRTAAMLTRREAGRGEPPQDRRIVLLMQMSDQRTRALNVSAIRETDQRALCGAIVPALGVRLSDATGFCERRGATGHPNRIRVAEAVRPASGAHVQRITLTDRGDAYEVWVGVWFAGLGAWAVAMAVVYGRRRRWGLLALFAALTLVGGGIGWGALDLGINGEHDDGWADDRRFALLGLTPGSWANLKRVEIGRAKTTDSTPPSITVVYPDHEKRWEERVEAHDFDEFCAVLHARVATLDPSLYCAQKDASGVP